MYIDCSKKYYSRKGEEFKITGYVTDDKSDEVIVTYTLNGEVNYEILKKYELENFIEHQVINKRKNIIRENNIKHIFHFTDIDNLDSILENGILSKNKLIESNINFIETDSNRYDDMLDYVNTSISYFNYKILYELTMSGRKMVLLTISNNPLMKEDTLFSNKNAASSDAIISNDIEALYNGNRIYTNYNGEKLRLNSRYPTNPSAEALIKDKIEEDEIVSVTSLQNIDSKDKDKIKSLTRNVGVPYLKSYAFMPRCDWRKWI